MLENRVLTGGGGGMLCWGTGAGTGAGGWGELRGTTGALGITGDRGV